MAYASAHDLNCLNLGELETLARDRMDRQTRDYYNEGADDNTTLRENLSAYQKYRIRPRILRDVSNIDTTVEAFGFKNRMPLFCAPTAMQALQKKLAHPDGEIATARACQAMGVTMGLSSFATSTLEELYLFEEREHSRKLLDRAKKAGYKAVFLTVDTPALGRRNAEIRNMFKLPPHLKIANFPEEQQKEAAAAVMSGGTEPSQESQRPQESKSGYSKDGQRVLPTGPIRFHTHAANPTLSWGRDIEWLKEQCGKDMQVWIKGVATYEDALLALQYGIDGIVVSNHGGRQLNGALATLDALPEVVEAVKGRIPVAVDGGCRHGTDIFKALALGADFVWIGRPVLWGLAYKGQAGVELCLKLLLDEFTLCMALAGVTKVKDINRDSLVKVDRNGNVVRLSKL